MMPFDKIGCGAAMKNGKTLFYVLYCASLSLSLYMHYGERRMDTNLNMKRKARLRIRTKDIVVYLLGVFLYYAWFQTFYNMVAFKSVFPYAGFHDMLEGIRHNLLPIALISVLNTLVVFKATCRMNATLKIVADVCLSLVLVTAVNLCYIYISTLCGGGGFVDWAGTMLNSIMLLLINEVAYYVWNYRNSARRAEKAQRLAIQLRYDVLKAQVNPHFLFNSLNILYSLTVIDIEKSREFIMSLSKTYRYIMSQQGLEHVLLTEELKFLHSYVDVLKIRYYNCFSVEITGEELAGTKRIVPYSMQLLIENVTKHNVIQAGHPMTVSIRITADCVVVSNPIRRKSSVSSSGIGLHYLAELYGLHGRQFSYTDDGSVFTVCLPYL